MVQLSHPYMTTEKPSTGKCILDGDGGGDQLDNVSTLNSWIRWNFAPSHGIIWRGRGCALSSLRYTCSPSPLQASLSFLVPVGQSFCLCSLMSSDNSHLYHCLWPPARHIHLLIPKCHFGLIKNERPVLGLDQLSSTTLLQPVRTGSDPNTCSHNRSRSVNIKYHVTCRVETSFPQAIKQHGQRIYMEDFPYGPVVKNAFQWRRCGFNPWSGN